MPLRIFCTLAFVLLSSAPAVLAADEPQRTVARVIADLKPVREPLPYRMVSFHRGRADKALIKRAQELGFNGVEFQLEGSTVKSLEEFAKRNAEQGYLTLCHELGMKVTLWVHELSDIPTQPEASGYLGPIELGNEKLWKHLEQRYEWLLGELLPDIDGLTLTVVETQINATDTPLMSKLVGIIRDACRRHGKVMIVRTFTWHPEELEGVLGCVRQLPTDCIIMTKCVPQDWQMRGINDRAIGAVGDHEQIVEYDVAGEYFLTDHVANCMPELLKRQFDYGLTRGVDGICVRVDRGDAEVLHHPNEVNLWALGLFAGGKTSSVDDVWKAWATFRYGPHAAAHVIAALSPAQTVVTECLNVGTLTFGDSRGGFPRPERDAFHVNWANWRWDPAYIPEYDKARTGDPRYVAGIKKQKEEATRLAALSLAELAKAKDHLSPIEYDILQTKLLTNQVQLAFRAPMMLAYLALQRMKNTNDTTERQTLRSEIQQHLTRIRAVMTQNYPPSRRLEHLGRTWHVGAPTGVHTKSVKEWLGRMESAVAEAATQPAHAGSPGTPAPLQQR